MNTQMRLQEIGDRLEHAFATDLEAEARIVEVNTGRARRWSWFARRRARLLGAVVAVIAVPGVAYAAGAFTSPQEVANSLPSGAQIFGYSHVSCTVVKANVEYHCKLAKPPVPDPVTGLTEKQWAQLTDSPAPNLGPMKVVGHTAYPTPRQERLMQAHRDNLLLSFGFTPAQIKQDDVAIADGTAGIPAGGFKGTVEPTIDATHHVDGGCRATSADGSQWECYIGQAAVQQKVIGPPPTNPGGFGLGSYVAQGPGLG
jgi:hypothetical protein